MTPTEHPTLSVTSPIIKSPDVEALKNTRLSNSYTGDMYGQYNSSTHMMVNNTPVPGVQNNNTIYSSSTYNQYNNGPHHQSAILPSPPFIHSNLGSPSPSVTAAYSTHPQHYSNPSTLPLSSPQSQHATHPTMRTVYLGNMAPDTQVSDILDQVRSGVIEIVRPLPEKNCIFLTFVDATAAAHFCHEFSSRPFNINGVELKIGWGKPSTLPTNIRLALQNGASRNVFLGSLDETVNEDVIREDLKRFGTVEHVRLIREKNIAFVHFLSIANAIKCVTSLPTEGEWQNRRVYYGKDRCCQIINTVQSHPAISTPTALYTGTSTIPTVSSSPYPPPHHYHSHSSHHQPIHVQHTYQVRYSPTIAYDPYLGTTMETYPGAVATAPPPPPPPPPASSSTTQTIPTVTSITGIPAHRPSTTVPPLQQSSTRTSTPSSHHPHLQIHPNQTATLIPALTSVHGDMTIYHPHPTNNGGNGLTGVANRTIYLGNIHPDTTCEEICNVIRGGILSQIRYMVDKHIAFIAFVDPVLALHFYTQASYHGIVIKSRRLKIGWGKPSSLPGAVIQAVQNGGSRNVYLGNMDDSMTEEKLKQDFSEYGDIELVNTLKEKNCAFVNFTSIAAAMRAIEGIRTKEEYKRFRINYGKDRCGNPPRSLQQQQQHHLQQQQHQQQQLQHQQQQHHHHQQQPHQPSSSTPTGVVLPTISSTSSVDGLATSSNISSVLQKDSDLLLMDTSDSPGLEMMDPATVAAAATVAFTNTNGLPVAPPLPDLITPTSALQLQNTDVDDRIKSNGVLNSVLDS